MVIKRIFDLSASIILLIILCPILIILIILIFLILGKPIFLNRLDVAISFSLFYYINLEQCTKKFNLNGDQLQ